MKQVKKNFLKERKVNGALQEGVCPKNCVNGSLSEKLCKWIYVISADWNPFVK